jgi:hypothetical protein
MPISLSQASIPVFEIGLAALSGVLDKAEAFAAAKKLDASVLTTWRLAPDMFALARQARSRPTRPRTGRRASLAWSRPATRTPRPRSKS